MIWRLGSASRIEDIAERNQARLNPPFETNAFQHSRRIELKCTLSNLALIALSKDDLILLPPLCSLGNSFAQSMHPEVSTSNYPHSE